MFKVFPVLENLDSEYSSMCVFFRLHRSMGHGLCGNDDAAAWMKRQAEFPVEQIFKSRLKHVRNLVHMHILIFPLYSLWKLICNVVYVWSKGFVCVVGELSFLGNGVCFGQCVGCLGEVCALVSICMSDKRICFRWHI